jgi:phosphatidylglycerol:prolipoprotein diacylglycerol transferase
MHRILFTIPGLGFSFHSFSLMMLLACFGALGITFWRARREGIDPESVSGLAVWLISGGFIGARVMFLLMHPEAVQQISDIVKIWQGGIVYYGCIIGGLIGSVIYWVRHPFPFRAMADAVAPALALGSALGRIGCFLNGCCYGAPTRSPLAIAFPAGSPPWIRHVEQGLISPLATHSLAVHPTQLYSALDALLVLALLTWFYPRRRRDGEVMALLMVTYPILRFANECLRGDEGPILAGLSAAQLISVGLFMAGVATWVYLARLPQERSTGQNPGPDPVPRPARSLLFSPRKV